MIRVNDIQAALAAHTVIDSEGDHRIGASNRSILDETAAVTPAGVLVPLVERPNMGLNVILTQRSAELRRHAGQVSFPGGRRDDGDADLTVTALREAEEEIGLQRSHVTVLGELNAYRTGTGYQITPIVGHVPGDFKAVPEPGEVADVFEVPLDLLMDEDNFELRSAVWNGKKRHYYAFDFGDRFIWGATAGILVSMSRIVRAYLKAG